MPVNRGLIALLRALDETGRVSASRLRSRAAAPLRPLIDAGVLGIERSGAGERVVVRKPEELNAFTARHFPEGLAAAETTVISRAQSISVSRDSKHVAPAAPPVLLFRGLPDTGLRSGRDALAVGELTTRYGAATLMHHDLEGWRLGEAIAVVENLEVFARFEILRERGLPTPIALYAGGRLDGRLLAWLAGQDADIWHCGDYDATGLNEYLRLRSACGVRARLFVPNDIRTLFNAFAKPSLGGINAELRQRLTNVDDPNVLLVVDLIRRTNCGLEQEILLESQSGA